MSLELHNEVVLITGAGRGIGRATALRLARAGCTLALVARTQADLQAVADEAAAYGCRVLPLPADITNDGQLDSTLRQVVTELGTVTVLINNAGWAPPRQPVAKAAIADWDRLLATCLRAPMVLSHLLVPDMLARKHGAIVNVASLAAQYARAGEAAYAAAKAGLIAFTRALFTEVRDNGIRVSAICPSYVDTGFVPRNRRVARDKFLRPEDVAEAIFQVLSCEPRACPTQVLLEPQFDPEKA